MTIADAIRIFDTDNLRGLLLRLQDDYGPEYPVAPFARSMLLLAGSQQSATIASLPLVRLGQGDYVENLLEGDICLDLRPYSADCPQCRVTVAARMAHCRCPACGAGLANDGSCCDRCGWVR